MKYIRDRLNEFDANNFIDELFEASKQLGILEAKISSYQFNSILIPMLRKKEAISSMYIEGTQTTISKVFEDELVPAKRPNKDAIEVRNHSKALIYGAEYLMTEKFSHSFIKKLHSILMSDIISPKYADTLGEYKKEDNKITNSFGATVFTPPSFQKTEKYMDELIDFMNNNHDINPLIKTAIIHAQFESIHPFSDGNGRVGRLLISLCLYKAKVINFPFFYISEAISQDKAVYYNKLTHSRSNTYDEWIKYFLKKCIIQAQIHTQYIESLNELYAETKRKVVSCINSSKYENVLKCLFTHPVLNSTYLAEELKVSIAQSARYLNILVDNHILQTDDRKKNKRYYFSEVLELARRGQHL